MPSPLGSQFGPVLNWNRNVDTACDRQHCCDGHGSSSSVRPQRHARTDEHQYCFWEHVDQNNVSDEKGGITSCMTLMNPSYPVNLEVL
jgi:hypothetical protein